MSSSLEDRINELASQLDAQRAALESQFETKAGALQSQLDAQRAELDAERTQKGAERAALELRLTSVESKLGQASEAARRMAQSLGLRQIFTTIQQGLDAFAHATGNGAAQARAYALLLSSTQAAAYSSRCCGGGGGGGGGGRGGGTAAAGPPDLPYAAYLKLSDAAITRGNAVAHPQLHLLPDADLDALLLSAARDGQLVPATGAGALLPLQPALRVIRRLYRAVRPFESASLAEVDAVRTAVLLPPPPTPAQHPTHAGAGLPPASPPPRAPTSKLHSPPYSGGSGISGATTATAPSTASIHTPPPSARGPQPAAPAAATTNDAAPAAGGSPRQDDATTNRWLSGVSAAALIAQSSPGGGGGGGGVGRISGGSGRGGGGRPPSGAT
jgi:hypothetical protein